MSLTDNYHGKHSQMGSTMKRSVFDEQTSKALKEWHKGVKKKKKLGGKSTERAMDNFGSAVQSTAASPVHTTGPALHRFKTTGHSTHSSTYAHQDEYESDTELSPMSQTTNLIVSVDHIGEQRAKEDKHLSAGETNC